MPHRYDIHGVLVDLPRVSVRADGGRDEVTGFAMRGDLFPLTDVPVG